MAAPGQAPAVAQGCLCPMAQSPTSDYPYWIVKQGCPTHDTFTASTVTTPDQTVTAPEWSATTPGVTPVVSTDPTPPAPSLTQDVPQSGSLFGIIGLSGGS